MGSYEEGDPVSYFLGKWERRFVAHVDAKGVHLTSSNPYDFVSTTCVIPYEVRSGFIYHGHHDMPDESEQGQKMINLRKMYYNSPKCQKCDGSGLIQGLYSKWACACQISGATEANAHDAARNSSVWDPSFFSPA